MTRSGVPAAGAMPGYAASRSWTPLALTIGLHLLLVLAWLTGTQRPAPEPAPRASTLVLVQPLARPRPAPVEPPQLSRPPVRKPRATTAPAIVPPAPATSAPSPEPGGEPQADAASDPAHERAGDPALPGELLASSKAMAGKVDRDLRKGSSPITAEPDRKWERFADAFAAARTGATGTVTLDSYTAPDGVIIYRKTVGKRVACYRSGSVGGLVTGFGAADGQGAGSTSCPSGVRWTRH